jgi:hypothetical protein
VVLERINHTNNHTNNNKSARPNHKYTSIKKKERQ